MSRPVLLGLVGDSAAGKTTLTRGLVRVLGDEHVTHVCTDDYHRFDRKERAERSITPLDPECNHIDVLEQDLLHLRAGEAILKPVYRHNDGTFGPPVHVEPKPITIVEGMLGFHTRPMRDAYDLRVFLAPPEDLRRHWKVRRDSSRRGYTTDEVLEELARRETAAERHIRPQAAAADLVVSFRASDGDDPEKLEAELIVRNGARDDVSLFTAEGNGIVVFDRGRERHVRIPGDIGPERAAEIEETIWDSLHFARHLRSQRLGEFTVATELHRSEPLALVQLLILRHLVTRCAAVALGSDAAAAVAAT